MIDACFGRFGARRILPVHLSVKDKEHCLWYDVELCEALLMICALALLMI